MLPCPCPCPWRFSHCPYFVLVLEDWIVVFALVLKAQVLVLVHEGSVLVVILFLSLKIESLSLSLSLNHKSLFCPWRFSHLPRPILILEDWISVLVLVLECQVLVENTAVSQEITELHELFASYHLRTAGNCPYPGLNNTGDRWEAGVIRQKITRGLWQLSLPAGYWRLTITVENWIEHRKKHLRTAGASQREELVYQ